jgi:hypothetical protein
VTIIAQIIDHQQLALVHPPGERDQQETERIQNSGHVAKPIIASRAGCRARNFRDGNGSGFRYAIIHKSTSNKGYEDFAFGENRWDLIVLSYVLGREVKEAAARALPG